jgi:HAD superfamily phosphoserine phosphatase-like hydrolase
MTHVATLIAHPDCPWLDDPHAARARALLPDPGKPDWLDPGVAVDLPFTPAGAVDARALADALRAELDPTQCDVVVQEVGRRRKRLFVADMDSTMIGQECIDELAAFVGLKEHVAAITERAMRGEIAFEPALRERVALLKGLPVSVVDEVIATRITLTRGGRELVRTMRANGAWTALVSGGFTLFTGPIAAAIGFDENRANRLIVEDGASPARSPSRSSASRPSSTRCANCARRAGSTRATRWPSATAPTTSPCSARRASASPIGPSPQLRRPRMPGSTMPTSPGCSMRRGIGRASSRRRPQPGRHRERSEAIHCAARFSPGADRCVSCARYAAPFDCAQGEALPNHGANRGPRPAAVLVLQLSKDEIAGAADVTPAAPSPLAIRIARFMPAIASAATRSLRRARGAPPPHFTWNSMRRFCARPSKVSLLAAGRSGP